MFEDVYRAYRSARFLFIQARYASFWRNHTRRLGARLGFYTAWLESDFRLAATNADVHWTWNPIPQWRRNNELVQLLKARAAAAKNEDFLRRTDGTGLRPLSRYPFPAAHRTFGHDY